MSDNAQEPSRVLVVDDDVQQLDIMKRWLEHHGFQPLLANSGTEALEMTRRDDVDVILLDVMMPEMDGLTVCARLRENPATRAIPVILLTAKDDLETRAQGMGLGVSEYITKPVNKSELLTRLRSQLHSRSLQRELARTAAALKA